MHEVVENRSGGTEYNCWSEFGGVFAYPMKWMGGNEGLGVLFDETFQSLKSYTEGKENSGKLSDRGGLRPVKAELAVLNSKNRSF